MSIWPTVEHGGFATKDLVTREKVRVTAACYLPGVRTPLHVHPHHDQCIMIADGNIIIITEKGRRTIESGDSIIVGAGTTHAFESGNRDTRFLSVFLGEGANEPGKTALPNRLRRILDTKRDPSQITETLLSPEQVGQEENLNETERETLSWVINRLIKRIETGRVNPTKKSQTRRTKKLQDITAWRKGDTLFLWTKPSRILISLCLNRRANMRDFIQLNDVDIYWPSLKHLPKVEVVK